MSAPLRATVAGILLAVGVGVSLTAQVPPFPVPMTSGQSGGSGFVSPSVAATFLTRTGDSELHRLVILVLWRGSPGWMMRQGSGGSSSSGGGGAAGVWTSLQRIGGIELEVRVESANKRAYIGGRGVDLREANVFLVDDVDNASRGVIVDTFYVEAALPAVRGQEQILPVLQASPEIRAFLRCGVGPSARRPPGFPELCALLRK